MSDAAARRLIDRLRPDTARAGRVRRLLATTYNLQADFFDRDFLCTALSVSEADFSGHSGQLALQRKLAELDYCGVLCDARAYEQRPSLRTVVHPVSLRGACLHSKLVVVEYEHAVKILVGSANLTESGYRQNREVCGELLAYANEPEKLARAMALLRAARSTLAVFEERAREFMGELDGVVSRLVGWAPRAAATESPVVWSDGTNPLWRTVVERWPSGRKVERISIVSPFWSEDGSRFTPLRQLLSELRSRDALAPRCSVDLLVESVPLVSGGFDAKFEPPLYYADFPSLTVRVCPVDPTVAATDLDIKADPTALRPLHAKVLVLVARDGALAYAGSGNFTRNGFGFRSAVAGSSAPANIEAGWLFELAPAAASALLPPIAGEGRLIPSLAQPGAAIDLVDEELQESAFWPESLLSAELTPASEVDALKLTTTWARATPSGWSVFASQEESEGGAGEPLFVTVAGDAVVETALGAEALRSILRGRHILIRSPEGSAVFPVNIAPGEARQRLPLSPSGAKPGESDLLSFYQGRITFEDLYPEPEPRIGADKRSETEREGRSLVDKSGIQAYQIRAFVDALPGIRRELSEEKGTRGQLYQAFLGEVSPCALALHVLVEVSSGRRTVTAAAFQLAELAALLRSTWRDAPSDVEHYAELCAQALSLVEDKLALLRVAHPRELGEASTFSRYVSKLGEARS